MDRLKSEFRKFVDDSGVTLVEYGIALVLAILIGGVLLNGLAGQIGNNMGQAETAIRLR